MNYLRAQRGDQLIQFQSAESSATSSSIPQEHVNLFHLEEQGVRRENCDNEIDLI